MLRNSKLKGLNIHYRLHMHVHNFKVLYENSLNIE